MSEVTRARPSAVDRCGGRHHPDRASFQLGDRGAPEDTKNKRNRVIPIGTRLAAELTMRRHAPDGIEHPPTAYVFGDATSHNVRTNARTRWT